MPVMDGLQATELIRAEEAMLGGHIPIVAMTAHAMAGDAERCIAVGMDGYLRLALQPSVSGLTTYLRLALQPSVSALTTYLRLALQPSVSGLSADL